MKVIRDFKKEVWKGNFRVSVVIIVSLLVVLKVDFGMFMYIKEFGIMVGMLVLGEI